MNVGRQGLTYSSNFTLGSRMPSNCGRVYAVIPSPPRRPYFSSPLILMRGSPPPCARLPPDMVCSFGGYNTCREEGVRSAGGKRFDGAEGSLYQSRRVAVMTLGPGISVASKDRVVPNCVGQCAVPWHDPDLLGAKGSKRLMPQFGRSFG